MNVAPGVIFLSVLLKSTSVFGRVASRMLSGKLQVKWKVQPIIKKELDLLFFSEKRKMTQS